MTHEMEAGGLYLMYCCFFTLFLTFWLIVYIIGLDPPEFQFWQADNSLVLGIKLIEDSRKGSCDEGLDSFYVFFC